MRRRGYIVPTDLLTATPPSDGWHATVITEVPSRSLVMVEWLNPNLEAEFESLPDVLELGDAWEIPPYEVLALLSSAAQLDGKATGAATPSQTDAGAPAPPDPVLASETLANALKKLDWPLARWLR